MRLRSATGLPSGTSFSGGRPPEARSRASSRCPFRVAREPRRLYQQFRRIEGEHRPLTDEDMLAEEQALAALAEIELYLAKLPSGVLVPNASLRLLPGEPPQVRVHVWVPEDAPPA